MRLKPRLLIKNYYSTAVGFLQGFNAKNKAGFSPAV